MASKGIFIVGAKRTPFCSYGGPLRELPACHAFAATAKDALHSANVDPTLVDQSVVGNAYYLSQCDGGKTPRYCGIYSGVPIEKPALGVSKACGTGLQAIITGAVDHTQGGLVDGHSGLSLAKIAEELARKYHIQREEIDEFALNSHLKWKAAQDSEAFADQITSLIVTLKKKEVLVDKDQIQQVNLDLEHLRQLPALSDAGVVTSGNSSMAADGAAALVIASSEAIQKQNLKPLARVAGWTCVGVDPGDTGVGALAAIKKLLGDQRLRVEDIDLFEINETFASQVLATAKDLNLDLFKVNVNGGALALGHPMAATGARMATNLVHELRRRDAKRAIAASSCGGGQGVAILLETL